MNTLPKQVQQAGETADALLQGTGAQPGDAPAPATPTQGEDWEKRFKGLKKTYDALVPQLRRENEELKTRVEALEQAPAKPVDLSEVLTEEERENYSPEFLDMVRRVVERVGGASVASRLDRLEDTMARSKEDEFWDAVEAAVPNWAELQATDEMQAWLAGYDELMGTTRSQAVSQAQVNYDAKRVIAIFNSYLGNAPQPGADTGEETLIFPDTGTASTVAGAQGKRTFKVSEVNAFYKKLSLLTSKGQRIPKEYLQLEREIEQASIEGRIIQG